MKFGRLFLSLSFLAPLVLASPSFASLSLRQGLYWGGGSRYIVIAIRGDRVCYSGSSPNGYSISSVSPIPQQPGFHKIEGFEDITLSQVNSNTVLFGGSEYTLEDSDIFVADELADCLNSSIPYFHRESF
ncbi:MAG: hypothetical protein SAJ12_12090 [Jaaginema sp. PMC 1079.18]|nr:hypothetical protein [Jaaginema sp. PMC 1080.18]MEC4851747.1 hypothetical protein [Jaaginema sp. PMC 1079.18]MEC4864596.1 hypothetical protein [Jaaginema sp. PMC 1078.18]